MNRAWIYVMLTSLFELLWIFGFNVANVWWHWAIIVPVIVVDFIVLSKACELLPTGTVYAIFAAAGTVGTSLMDVFIFGEAFILEKGFFIGLLVIGVISLNLADNKSNSNMESGGGVA
ncbi:DMT family transporter [Bacillaceae bacterium W0354]